jgi:hypothetical protein
MATAPEPIARPSNRFYVTSQESAASSRPSRINRFLAEPFRASAWKRPAYILLALPAGLLCVAGAWAVHAAFGGVVFFFLAAWVMRGFTALQARLSKGLLGAGGSGLVRTILPALGTALICSLLSVPVIHQL